MRHLMNVFQPALLGVLLVASGSVLAQRASEATYPSRPIRFIVPQAAGGSNDTLARYLGQHLSERLGKPVVVENRAGADGIIGTEIASRATPDGHALFMASSGYTMNAAVRKVTFDPAHAFTWVAMLGHGTTALVTTPQFPANSVKDIIALGKAKPNYLNIASAGGFQHFITEQFRHMAGIDATIVLYKGGFPALIDVMGGQAHMLVGSLVTSQAHIRAGKLKAIATGGARRSPLFPELPTIGESGLPGYEASNYWAIAAPAGTPAAIVKRLNDEVGAILALPETRKRFTAEAAETDHKTPAELDKFIKSELAKWARVAKEAGMKREQ